MPNRRVTRSGNRSRYPWRRCAVGESFNLAGNETYVRNIASRSGKRMQAKFAVRKLSADAFRVERIA